jgi:hypothetical protein
MKNLLLFFLLIFWMLITLLLSISVIGLFAFVFGEDNDWWKIGRKLTEDFKLN